MERGPIRSRSEVQRGREIKLNKLGLTMGEPLNTGPRVRGAEYYGIYKDGKHIGNVVGDSPFEMKDDEFFRKVGNFDVLKEKFTLTIGDGVEEVLRNAGVIMSQDNKLTVRLENGSYANLDLYNNGGNVGVEIIKKDETSVLVRCIESSGKVIEYPLRQGVIIVSERRESNLS